MVIMTKTKLPLLLCLLLSFFFLCLTSSSVLAEYEPSISRDPQTQKEYDQVLCQRSCEQRERGHQQQCVAICEEKLREQEREDERQRHVGSGTGGLYNADPQQEYQQCLRRCQQRRESGSQCQKRCEERRREQDREEQERESTDHEQGDDNPQSTEEEEENNNPYYFTKQHFNTPIKTSEGYVGVLEKFSKRSELLKGIENYRFAILEANPSTFTVPHHLDADEIAFVVKGNGSISLFREDKKETYNLEKGDVMRVLPGSVAYLINRDNTEKLVIVKIIQPAASTTPGEFQIFFAGGGEDPESFYGSFSEEILEAAFNTPREILKRTLIGQQKKGAIIKASQEQIKALSPQKHGGESRDGPINLLHQRPIQSNSYGQHFLVTEKDYKQLRDMDVAVSFFNISSGAMSGPSYDTRSTKVCAVLDGSGYYEMACPHMSSSSGGGGSLHKSNSSGQYQKMSAKFSAGDVVVVPAGYPTVVVASRDQNVQAVCFHINARDNEITLFAGKNNVLKEMEREAKELAFGVPAREIERVINAQMESLFYPGPQQQKEQARAYA